MTLSASLYVFIGEKERSRERKDYIRVYMYGPVHSWAQLSNSLLQYCQHANTTLHNWFALQMAISIATNAGTAIYMWQLDAALMRFGVRRSHQKLLLCEKTGRSTRKGMFLSFSSPKVTPETGHSVRCTKLSCTYESQNDCSCLNASLPIWPNILKDNVSLWKKLPSYRIVISKASSRKFLNITN